MTSSQSLTTAREKLQAPDVPMTLRISSYLRISCLALKAEGIRYSSLMQALSSHNPQWMETCAVSPEGYLESSDCMVSELLSPINALHRPTQFLAPVSPAAQSKTARVSERV